MIRPSADEIPWNAGGRTDLRDRGLPAGDRRSQARERRELDGRPLVGRWRCCDLRDQRSPRRLSRRLAADERELIECAAELDAPGDRLFDLREIERQCVTA